MTQQHWPEPVRDVLDDLNAELQRALDDELVGLYVFGSLVTGDFDLNVSDIDVLAVLSTDLTGSMFERLDRVHAAVPDRHLAWINRLEVIYFAASALASFRGRSHPIAAISPGEQFNTKVADEDWNSNWYVVRNYGVTLLGPDPKTLIGPIDLTEITTQQRKLSAGWGASVTPESKTDALAYQVLTACRALYTAENHAMASKRAAAEWASTQMPEWATLLAEAQTVRATGGNLDPTQVRGFLEYAATDSAGRPQAPEHHQRAIPAGSARPGVSGTATASQSRPRTTRCALIG